MNPVAYQSRRIALVLAAIMTLASGASGQMINRATPVPSSQASPAPPPPTQAAPVPVPLAPAQPEKLEPKPAPALSTAVTDGTGSRASIDVRTLHELSPWSMFLAADVLVKGVMIGLMAASLVTWTIFVGKSVELAVARRRLTKALGRIDRAVRLPDAKLAVGTDDGFMAGLIAAAMDELDISSYATSRAGVKERADSRFADLVRVETQAMRRGMGLLATIGSTSPFVGLFGTVWGIMNSFIGISKSQTTNLAVVAPGIAEALLATAIGLVAAIPAVIIYNHFSRATRSYQLLISRASGAVGRLLSHELDRERSAASSRAAE